MTGGRVKVISGRKLSKGGKARAGGTVTESRNVRK